MEEKVTCYKCNGIGRIKALSCIVFCETTHPNIRSEYCRTCRVKKKEFNITCPICLGVGELTWIEEMFRKE